MADWIKPWKYCMHIKWMPLVELVECVCVLCVFFCFCLFIAWLPCCFSRLLQILQHFACVVNSHVCNPCNRGSASVCLWVPVSRLMRRTKKRERATNRKYIYIVGSNTPNWNIIRERVSLWPRALPIRVRAPNQPRLFGLRLYAASVLILLLLLAPFELFYLFGIHEA